MALSNDEVISKLNHLLGTLRDGEKGHREAADEAENPQYVSMFNEYAQQRARLAEELKAEIRQLGGDPDDSGSVAAAAHRAWANVRDAIAGKGDYEIIAEAERGEDVAIDNYQDVMDENLPANIKDIVANQYSEVKAAHDRIRDLKHSLQDS